MAVLFRVGAVYAGMPLPVQWTLQGSPSSGSAVAQISVSGNVFWTSQPVNLPLTGIENVSVPPPNSTTVATLLYGTTSGNRDIHIDVVITSGGTVTVESLDNTFPVLLPRPFLEVASPIAPGAPITLQWGLDATFPPGLNASFPAFGPVDLDVEAQIVLQVRRHRLPPLNFVVAQVPTTPLPFGNSAVVSQSLSFVVPPPQTSTAYRFGTHALQIAVQVRSEGYRGTFVADSGYAVFPETVGPSSWLWSAPPGGIMFAPDLPPPANTPFLKVSGIGWNTPYSVGGRFVSTLTRSMVTAKVNLMGTSDWEEPPPPTGPLTLLASASVGPVVPGENDATGDVVFTGQIQNYTWLDEATGLFSQGAVRNEVTYFASITVSDVFGNTYPAFASSGFSVDGSVPDSKLSAAIAARVELAFAVFFALCAAESGILFGPAFAALSTFFYLEFQQNINNAKDPPKRSPIYRQPVSLKPTPIPRALTAKRELAGLRELLTVVSRISASQKGLSEMAGRFLGAQAAQDGPGMQLQLSSRALGLASLSDSQLALPLAAVKASLDLDRLLTPQLKHRYRQMAASFSKKGLTPSLRSRFRKVGLPKALINHLAKASRVSEMRASLPRLRNKKSLSIDPAFKELTTRMSALVTSILDESRGERRTTRPWT